MFIGGVVHPNPALKSSLENRLKTLDAKISEIAKKILLTPNNELSVYEQRIQNCLKEFNELQGDIFFL